MCVCGGGGYSDHHGILPSTCKIINADWNLEINERYFFKLHTFMELNARKCLINVAHYFVVL